MRFTIWGSRGSHPTPLTPAGIRSKIATVVQRIRPGDLKDAESRERFLGSLPSWLFGSTSSNTACVQLELDDRHQLVFDAGSGIINFAHSQLKRDPPPTEYHIFFTHFHHDHIQGLPFFFHAFNPKNEIHFYSPLPDLNEALSKQMRAPFFPVTMEALMRNAYFHRLGDGGEQTIELHGATVRWRELNHPGRAFGYRVDHGGRSFGYITDVELERDDFEKNDANSRFFAGLNAAILDTQYTLGEAIEKFSWGHSSFSLGVDFAVDWGMDRLYMFHHEPQYSDKKLEQNLQSAQWYANRISDGTLEVFLSREGETVDV